MVNVRASYSLTILLYLNYSYVILKSELIIYTCINTMYSVDALGGCTNNKGNKQHKRSLNTTDCLGYSIARQKQTTAVFQRADDKRDFGAVLLDRLLYCSLLSVPSTGHVAYAIVTT